MMPFATDRFLFIETFEGVEKGIDGASALRVRGKLPTLRASCMEDAVKLVRINEKSSPGVRVSLPVQLLAEGSVRHALIRSAHRLPTIESHFESREAEPLVAETGLPFRSVDFFFDRLDRPCGVDAPRQADTDRESLLVVEFLVKSNFFRCDGPIADTGESGFRVELQHLL